MFVSDFYHLSYCTNVHPGENWDVTFNSLKTYTLKVKQSISPEKPFGIGLRLSNKASEELGVGNNLVGFKKWLDENELYVYTINGFPYGNFHNEKVKENVHRPDWLSQKRLAYTARLFKQLAVLLPEPLSGGISTSPISYKHWFTSKAEVHQAKSVSAANMAEIAVQLYEIEHTKGVYLHLDIEPEPDGLLENAQDVIDFFSAYLVPISIKAFKKKIGLGEVAAEKLTKRYVTICYDICHFSLAYEEPKDTFQKFGENGIQIGKIQVSSALKILYDSNTINEIWQSLELFDEPTYLHQVTEKRDNKVLTYSDLPLVLNERKNFKELRAHFHVPIFLERFGHLHATQDHIKKVLQCLKMHKICSHIEVETYTWDVLPNTLKRELSESIIREMEWLKEKL